MNSENKLDLVIIAGPNGCGKTTVASFLIENQSIERFVNADIIAKGLSIAQNTGESEIGAGRIMLKDLHKCILQKKDIAFETTMAGKSWLKTIQLAKNLGYHTTICYVVVDSPDIAVERVKKRVLEGGHDIPEQTIRRRYHRSLNMFFSTYSDVADTWYFFDNSSKSALLLAQKEDGKLKIFIEKQYNEYQRSA